MGGRRRPRQAPEGAGPTAASRPPRKKGTRRRFWGVCLTEDIVAKLETAFATMIAGQTNVAAYLMDATGATRSKVRKWLRKDQQMPRLGRPTIYTVAEEATIAQAIELWTVSGGLLTRELLGTLLCDYVADVEAVRQAQAKYYSDDDLVPGKVSFKGFRVGASSYVELRPPALTRPAPSLPPPRR